MPSVFDVAAYLLNKLAPDRNGNHLLSWQLQNLIYYCQAWSLVWDEREMFPEAIEAWIGGPVCPALHAQHKDNYHLFAGDIQGDPEALDDLARETIAVVLDSYADEPEHILSAQVQTERPWKEARVDTPPEREISKETMTEFYGGLLEAANAQVAEEAPQLDLPRPSIRIGAEPLPSMADAESA